MTERLRFWLIRLSKFYLVFVIAFFALEKALYRLGIIKYKPNQLPDFLGIGAQKSGTTWLYRNLRQHPAFFLPDTKELHFWDWNFYRKGFAWYCNHFKNNLHLKGEITPEYTMIPEYRIKMMAEAMPNAKLVFLLRNPIERAWSQACMNLLELPKKDKSDVPDEAFIQHFNSRRSWIRGDYETALNKYYRHFPKENLFIGFFEELQNDPCDLFNRIVSFLGEETVNDFSAYPIHSKINHNKYSSQIPAHFRTVLETIHARQIEDLYKIFGERVAHWRVNPHKEHNG